MRIVVEIGGTVGGDLGENLDRADLEIMFDRLAEALVELNEFEADVAINFETGLLELFLVVEGTNLAEGAAKADEVVSQALQAAGVVELERDSQQARRADPVHA